MQRLRITSIGSSKSEGKMSFFVLLLTQLVASVSEVMAVWCYRNVKDIVLTSQYLFIELIRDVGDDLINCTYTYCITLSYYVAIKEV